jgi:hypothetical protein
VINNGFSTFCILRTERVLEKTVKTASSLSGYRPFLDPVNFFHDASH